jgi:protein gp37
MIHEGRDAEMATKIEWTDEVWNPVTGCSKVSEGCRNCYAERLSHRFGWTEKPWTAANAVTNVQIHPERLEIPLHWLKPRKVFVNSMSDLFHEQVPFEFIKSVFTTMNIARTHTFQVLTKRPERMLNFINWYIENYFMDDSSFLDAFPNVWLGVSVENQQVANKRIPLLLQTPAAVRFLSCEPLLGPIDLTRIDLGDQLTRGYGKRRILWNALTGWESQYASGELPDSVNHPKSMVNLGSRIHWVIVGGESGPNARPMHPDWVRSIRDQCQEVGVPFFFKQFGEWAPVHELRCNEPGIKGKTWFNFDPDTSVCRVGKKKAGRLLDGRTWDEFPEEVGEGGGQVCLTADRGVVTGCVGM